VLPVGVGVVALRAEDDVVLLSCSVGSVGRRHVGRAQEQVLHLSRQALGLRVECVLLVPKAAALGHQRLGRGGVAVLAQAADVLREHLDAGPDLVPPGAELALARVEGDDLVDLVRSVAAPPGQPGPHGLGVAAEEPDVEHGPRR
jgi:hypothetical protein